MKFYNVHTHTFTMSNAPQRFLNMYMPDIAANAIDKITNTKAGASSLEWILKKVGGSAGKRYASFLSIGKSSKQLDVFSSLMQQYDSSMKFVALTIYMEQCGAGPSQSGFEGQLEEILMVKKQFSDKLLVFMGIDPRWKLSGTELRKTVQSYFERKIQITATNSVYPFAGLKLYPSTGFYTFDARLKETFEWAADNGVPVLSHCNYMGGIYNNDTDYVKTNLTPNDPYAGTKYSLPAYENKKRFWKQVLGTNAGVNNQNACSYFLEPASYRTMLTYFRDTYQQMAGFPKGLKLCLAHYGGDHHILAAHGKETIKEDELYSTVKQSWCVQIKDMFKDFPNLYTDISYAIHNPAIADPIISDLKSDAFRDRIMFGTDYFLTERELPEKADYTAFRDKAIVEVLSNGKNAWEQISSVNTERFLQSKYYS